MLQKQNPIASGLDVGSNDLICAQRDDTGNQSVTGIGGHVNSDFNGSCAQGAQGVKCIMICMVLMSFNGK